MKPVFDILQGYIVALVVVLALCVTVSLTLSGFRWFVPKTHPFYAVLTRWSDQFSRRGPTWLANLLWYGSLAGVLFIVFYYS